MPPFRTAALLLAVTLTSTASAQPARDDAVDPREALIAALGRATLDCLGTVGPSLYETSGGVLARTFRTCAPEKEAALAHIDSLLGVQFSAEGQADELAAYYVGALGRLGARL